MTWMPAGQGRGAWTTIGGPTPNYALPLQPGQPLVGSQTDRDDNHLAVWYGVKAIQHAFNRTWQQTPAGGTRPTRPLQPDGVFGPLTDKMARWYKPTVGLPSNGRVGNLTCQQLFHPDIQTAAFDAGIPRPLLCGLMTKESSADPGAVGQQTPGDHGLVQINLNVSTTVTLDQAMTPAWALGYAANRLADQLERYADYRFGDPWDIAIAQYNWPAGAASWYRTGQPPNQRIATYVQAVKTGCPL